jgi:hypothetical protein
LLQVARECPILTLFRSILVLNQGATIVPVAVERTFLWPKDGARIKLSPDTCQNPVKSGLFSRLTRESL